MVKGDIPDYRHQRPVRKCRACAERGGYIAVNARRAAVGKGKVRLVAWLAELIELPNGQAVAGKDDAVFREQIYHIEDSRAIKIF